MMWQAIIVDDEPIIRFGIKASIDWQQEGIEIVADCANGAEALQLIQQKTIDILITDIKMPIMDGLALTRHALEHNANMKVILVSSYNDFDYVREGLKLGVVDYILKHTLEPEELLTVITRCKTQLEQEKRGSTRISALKMNGLIDQRRHFENKLKHYIIQSAVQLADSDYPEWINSNYTAFCIRLNAVSAIEEKHGYLYKSILLEQFADALYGEVPQGLVIQTAENELFFLMPTPLDNNQPVELIQRGLKKLLEEDHTISVIIGYAEGDKGIDVRQVFEFSKKACERGFFEGSGIYHYHDGIVVQRQGVNLPDLFQTEGTYSEGSFQELINTWYSDWAEGGCEPRFLKEQACRVISMKYKHNIDPHVLVETFDRMFKTETFAELCETLKLSIVELRKTRLESIELGITHHPIDQALDYINRNYLEAMTLQQVADAVHVSKNYLSLLFKKVTGQNFIDYLIMLRVQKAKEMLTGTSLKVYEVAEKSGFNDVKYFSKLFKKMTGYTPVDYREYYLQAEEDSN